MPSGLGLAALLSHMPQPEEKENMGVVLVVPWPGGRQGPYTAAAERVGRRRWRGVRSGGGGEAEVVVQTDIEIATLCFDRGQSSPLSL